MRNGTTTSLRVFLVEDHPVMRLGLKMMLRERGFDVCGEAGSAQELVEALADIDADMAIFDLSLNGETAFELLGQVRARCPKLGMIVYSMHDAQMFVEKALRVGVNGYVTKADPVETLIEAIEAVRNGKRYLGPALTKTLEERVSNQGGAGVALDELSDRELEVLTFLGQGFGRCEIAERLSLSARTIETFFDRLKAKLGVRSNRELVREAIRIIHPG